MLEVSQSPETLLLCAATSANLTSLPPGPGCLEASHGLLSSLVRHPASASSVHIQEQVVTVINNVTRGSMGAVVSSAGVVTMMAGAVDYLLDLLSLAKLPPANTEHFVTAKRTATKAVIGEIRYSQTLIGFPDHCNIR